MYSIHSEGKSIVAERFIRTLKTKIYKYMSLISKNVYIDKLDDIVNEYNNVHHRIIKIKPVYVKDNTYIDSTELHSNKDPKFKVGDHSRISKYKIVPSKHLLVLKTLQHVFSVTILRLPRRLAKTF